MKNDSNLSFAGRLIARAVLLCVMLALPHPGYSSEAEAPNYSLEKKLSINAHNKSVKDILGYIEKNSDYIFFYKSDINADRKVNLIVENQTVPAIIEKLFAGTNISYEIRGRQISLKEDRQKSVPQKTGQHKRRVSGIVLDNATGEPLVGVTVSPKSNPGGGVMTDMDGKFSVDLVGNDPLKFSYVGYIAREEKTVGKSNLNVHLSQNDAILDDIVVVGYGTASRKSLTTSIAKVDADKVSKTSNATVGSMLLGRAAGVQATIASAEPGGGISISVRGSGTPMYIVDGVEMPSSNLEGGNSGTALPSNINRSGLASLNPADIESIEVLKDASAAIYGVKAANGVVLITTKKGREGKPSITYEGSYTVMKHYNYDMDRLDSRQYMEMVNLYDKEKYLYNKKMYPYGNQEYDGSYTPLFSDDDIRGAINTDWLGQVLQTGHVNNHNLTISGGTKIIKYYLGLNYYEEKGVLRNSGMQRYSLRTNIQAQLFPFLKLSTILNMNNNKYDNSITGGNSSMKDQAAGSIWLAKRYPTYLPVTDENGDYTIVGRVPNPIACLGISDKSRSNNMFASFTLDADLVKNWLSLRLLYGVNKDNSRRSSYIPEGIYFSLAKNSRGNLNYYHRQYETMEGTLMFNHGFANIVDVDAVIGMGRYVHKSDGMLTEYQNANNLIGDANISAANGPFMPTSSKGENERRSQFARVGLNFLDRYIVNATIRRDGTDKFFKNKKYSWFPSVSAAWRINNEKFLRDVDWISLLKLRASYGQTGNDNLGSTLYGTIGVSPTYVFFSEGNSMHIPYILEGATYTDVTWEKTTMKNIGVDFNVLNDRITLSVDLFRNDITDMLGNASTAPLNMYPTRPINGAHLRRSGVEVAITSRNFQTNDFTWTTSLNLSHYKAVWVERMPNYDYKPYQVRKNEPVNASYFYKYDGIINMDKSNMPESQKSLAAAAQLPGCPIIVDKNSDGVIDKEDIFMEDMTPKLYYGLGNNFRYKNWDLDIYLYGQLGVNKYNTTYATACSVSNLANGYETMNPATHAYNVWNSQANPNGTEPGYAWRNITMPEGVAVRQCYQNASFLRVRTIALGYTFDALKWKIFRGYLKSIRVFADITNPFIITKYKGDDPEIITTSNSVTGGQYPQVRSFAFGARITF